MRPPITPENFLLIDNRLKQGISTKMEVQRLLGMPNGSGAALLPKIADIPHMLDLNAQNTIPGIRYYKDGSSYEIWFYENMEFENHLDLLSNPNPVCMTQKFLLVFFHKQVYEGYFWYAGCGVVNVK